MIASGTRSPAVERGLDRLTPDGARAILEADGPLAATLPGFEARECQREMAAAVAATFREGGTLLVEAGTGTGKTLAYLVPAVLSGQRVVISTGTKNLQEQLYYKDIPLVRKALRIPVSACLMKGRGNYLCLARHAQFTSQPTFRFFEEAQHFETLQRWGSITKTGDRAEIPGVPELLSFWKDISARTENCTGKDCPDFDRCYVTRLRQRAAESEIIVVNHHLLLADLIVREGSFGEVIPDYDYLVLDEAHQIEDVATQYFGLTVSSARVEELARDAETAWQGKGRGEGLAEALRELQRLRNSGRALFDAFRRDPERYRIRAREMGPDHSRACDRFQKQLARVRARIAAIPAPDDTTVALARRAAELSQDLSAILEAEDPSSVSWCERRERSVALRSSPIDVAPLMRELLFAKKRAVLLTSATLSVDGSFDYLDSRLGVSEARRRLLPSPFDYGEQALLYVPRNLPAPRSPAYLDGVVAEIEALVSASRGRAFLLFTSFANLRAVRQRIEGKLAYPLLVQGDAARSELLERFRETKGAVLLATSSFWEGVDVVGEQLSCVIVDKLPFAVPGDPVVSARIDGVESAGGNGFRDYQVPMAILSLKQGLGRLIRARTDRGVVALLDSRVTNMSYGARFLSSLPPYRLTHDRGDVARFFARGAPTP